MRNHIITYYVCLVAFLAISCDRTMEPDSLSAEDSVGFYISNEKFSVTTSKSIVENTSALENLGLTLYVTDRLGATFDNTPVTYNSTTGLWKSDVTWKSQPYLFYAYTFSKGTGQGTSISITGDNNALNNGYYVDLYEPTSYVHDDQAWTDYLMSYRTSIDGSKKPLVEFQMERVTAGVELYISAPEGSSTRITSVSFSNVSRAAKYTNNSHAVVAQGSQGIRNIWRYSYLGDPVSYSRSDQITVANLDDSSEKYDAKYRMMRFITVPQTVTSELTIHYQVKESNSNWANYQASFNLADYPVKEWKYGYKTRYYINLDSSIELEGIIAEWTDIEYVEGVFLPELPY